MGLANCKECGKLFNQTLRSVCPNCQRIEDEKFFKVRDYLRKHKGATPSDVSTETGVSLDLIYRWIQEGRLLAKEYTGLYYQCERCGKQITTGKYCGSCSEELTNTVSQLSERVLRDNTHTPEQGYYSRNNKNKL